MKFSINKLWGEFFLGVIFFILGTLTGLYGGWYRDAPVPSEGGWVMAGGGLIVVFLAIRGILRGEGKPRPYTDKDIEDSKRRLEQMYIKEHGELPPTPRQDEQENSEKEKKR